MTMRFAISVLAGVAAFCCEAGEFALSAFVSDNAVLQRDKDVRVWGTAGPGAEVRVTFAGQDVSVLADEKGAWIATLKPMAASKEGRTLSAVSGGKTLTARNVLVGEVWLCSGQSNMEQPLWGGGWGGGWSARTGNIEARLAKYPFIRAYRAKNARSKTPCEEAHGEWRTLTDSAAIRRTYAIAFHFARTLRLTMPDVPVGIVEAAWGGTSIQPWTPDDTAEIYNFTLHPIRRMAFRGALWYQGENNMADGMKYKDRLHRLVVGWRREFAFPDMPFYLAEIAPFAWGADGKLAVFHEAQHAFAKEDGNAACIVINDCGHPDTVHPDRKALVGQRFALVALNRQYGRTDLVCDSPEPIRARSEAGAVIVEFDRTKELGVNSHPVHSQHRIRGFEVAGADDVWKDATQVELVRNTVRVSTPEVARPVRVRYLWKDGWHEGQLFAADSNLQVGSFRMEAPESTIDPDLQAKCQAVCDWAVAEGLQNAVQFCAYRDGKCIVDVWAGTMSTNVGSPKITGATLFPIFSTEKPLLATAVHRAVEKKRMDYNKPISTWWPEFTGDGKENLTLGLTLGYRSGMSAGFPKGINGVEDECDWKKICTLAAAEKPEIEPGTVQRYMSISYAWMLGRPLEKAMGKRLNDVLVEEVLRPAGIEHDFYFAADAEALKRIGTAYNRQPEKQISFATMNDDRRRKMCLPSAYAVADARAIARFYNRLEGFDGAPPILRASTLDAALKPCRHESDPLPDAKTMKEKWFMLFGMGYGLWGEPGRLDRLYGHGGVGGSEGLCDRDLKLTVGFTCDFDKDVRKVRSKLYGIVGIKWRYWDDAEADIQNLQMSTIGNERREMR